MGRNIRKKIKKIRTYKRDKRRKAIKIVTQIKQNNMNDLETEFFDETCSRAQLPFGEYGNYSEKYVKWLEKKLQNRMASSCYKCGENAILICDECNEELSTDVLGKFYIHLTELDIIKENYRNDKDMKVSIDKFN